LALLHPPINIIRVQDYHVNQLVMAKALRLGKWVEDSILFKPGMDMSFSGI
jgi:hypothetical protein